MDDQVLVSAPESVKEALNVAVQYAEVRKIYQPAPDNKSMLDVLMKSDVAPGQESAQGVNLGRKMHPFDMCAVTNFQTSNEHHSTCIQAKVASTVGLGFLSDETQAPTAGGTARPKESRKVSKVDRILNPLCDHSWQDTLNDIAEDFWQTGNGYLEVVRKGGENISGLHHIPAPDVHIFIENTYYDRHYEVRTDGKERRFARFGDKDAFIKRSQNAAGGVASFQLSSPDRNAISEVIHFRRPTSLSRWYGFPDWLAAVAAIELVQCLRQYKFDFFLNRGVPEFMLFILGVKLPKDDWAKIETALKANIGSGNAFKSLAVNLATPADQVKVQVEKLAMEGKTNSELKEDGESLGISIVTAHGVPPLLAGILIPGKLGATNELPNAIQAFQLLKIGPAQRIFKQTLASTLGNDKLNGDLKLKETDFDFNRITDEIDLGQMDTTSRMRTPVATANAQGRDLKAGLKKGDDDATDASVYSSVD